MARTEVEYSLKSIKFLMTTITTMFLVVATLMLILGTSVYSRYHDFTFLLESVKSGHYLTPAILVILIGVIMLCVTLIGFFGSLKESTLSINVYALVLSLVLVLELVVVIMTMTMDRSTIGEYINIPVEYYTTDAEIQTEMDMLQTSLTCCGSESYTDYIYQEFNSNHSTVVIHDYKVDDALITLVLPESCCSSKGEDNICVRVWSTGCKYSIVGLVSQNAGVLGVLGMSVAFIQLLGIIFAILLAKCIRKAKSERAFLRWKLREQMITARQSLDQQIKEKQSEHTIYIQHSDSTKA